MNRTLFEANEASLMREEQTYTESMKLVITSIKSKINEIHETCEGSLANLQHLISNFSLKFNEIADIDLKPNFKVNPFMTSATFGAQKINSGLNFQTPLVTKGEFRLPKDSYSPHLSGAKESIQTAKQLDQEFQTVQSEIIENTQDYEIDIDNIQIRSDEPIAIQIPNNRDSSKTSKDLVNFSTKRSAESRSQRVVENPEEEDENDDSKWSSPLLPLGYERIVKAGCVKKSKAVEAFSGKYNPIASFSSNYMI